MMQKARIVGVSAAWFLCTVLFAAGTFADGVILPDNPQGGWLTVVYHDVDVTIRDGVVTTEVDQVFRNDTTRSIEGRYVFPLPPGAIVTDFSLWVDGEPVEGEILDALQARSIYEEHVRRAIDPALLEYVGRDTLSLRIFPISAGRERRVRISYTELLEADNGVYRYRYPLNTERFSARPIESVSIDVSLETTVALSAVYSPSHDLAVVREDANHASGAYEERQVLPVDDFLLYYAVSADTLGMTLLTYDDPTDDSDGVFMLIATPPNGSTDAEAIPKDLVFVLDRSGSMQGDKIEQAKEALQYIVSNLNPDDRFAVVSFSDFNEALHSRLQPVSAGAVSEAVRWVGGISAGGGTNIDAALELALEMFDQRDERLKFLVFLTDGEPTVGEENPATIAAHAAETNHADARVFVFGVGYNVNTVLLDQLAQENRGTTTYVLPGEDLESSLASFYRKIASPVLADLALQIESVSGNVATYDLFPRVLPDLFRGTQLIVVGRYRGVGTALMTVSGRAQGADAAYATVGAFSDRALESSFLPRLWAGRKIAFLLDQIRLYGESDELVDEVISLSQRYGIITPYTSFLVDDDEWAHEEMAGAVFDAAAPAAGATAVQGSSALRTLAESETVQTAVEGVQAVADRVYFLRDEIWTDSTYEDQETIDVVLYSDAYFDLLDAVPWIAEHLAIGERVIIRVGEVYVRVGEEGLEQLPSDVLEALAG